MATFLYKAGRRELVAPEFVQNMLRGGWSVTEAPTIPEPAEELDEDELPTVADMRTPRQVRQEAKEAGIDVWETARIRTLKGLLDEHKN